MVRQRKLSPERKSEFESQIVKKNQTEAYRMARTVISAYPSSTDMHQ